MMNEFAVLVSSAVTMCRAGSLEIYYIIRVGVPYDILRDITAAAS